MRKQISDHPGRRVCYAALLLLLWTVAVYLLAVPLWLPRAGFLWGHHRLKDLYLGVPCFLAAMLATRLFFARPPARYRLALRLGTVFIVTWATFLTCDLTVAAWEYWTRADLARRAEAFPGSNRPDRELLYRRRASIRWSGRSHPNAAWIDYRTDREGFRNTRKAASTEIAFVGDSFTEAVQVREEDTFVQRVGAATKRAVRSFGLSGYGPQQELGVLRRYVLPAGPRFVVWQLFEGNDGAEAEAYLTAQGRHTAPLTLGRLLELHTAHSPVVRLLNRTLPPPPQLSEPASIRSCRGQLKAELVSRYEPDAPRRWSRGWLATLAALDAGAELCASRGVALVVFNVPIRARTATGRITFASTGDRNRFLPQGRRTSPRDFHTLLGRHCRERGIAFIDLYPALRLAADAGLCVYVPGDEHLDVDGHAVVAGEVARWIGGHTRISGSRGLRAPGNPSRARPPGSPSVSSRTGSSSPVPYSGPRRR